MAALNFCGIWSFDLISVYYVDPAFRRFDVAHLDTSERIEQFLKNRSHFSVIVVFEDDFFAVVVYAAYRAYNSCCAAQAHLFVIVDFIEIYLAFIDLHAEDILSNISDGTACY